jgi:hypothetical protein
LTPLARAPGSLRRPRRCTIIWMLYDLGIFTRRELGRGGISSPR